MKYEIATLQIRVEFGITRMFDHACGNCEACLRGVLLSCTEPWAVGVEILRGSVEPDVMLRGVTAAAAFASSGVPADAVVLVLADEPTLARLIRMIHDGPILEAASSADPDVRAALQELTPTGRPDVVVTDRQGRAAVKAVVRGGMVVLPFAEVDAPSVTELVQREVTLIGPKAVQDLVNRVGHRAEIEAVL